MSLRDIYQVLSYTSLLSTALPLLLLTRVPGLSSLWRILAWYLLIALMVDLASFVLVKGLHKGNFNLIYTFNFVEAFFIGWFFKELFGVNRGLIVWFFGLAVVELSLFSLFPRDFNSIFAVLVSITFLLFCVYYFYQLMDDLAVTFLIGFPWFWVVSGIAFYFGISLFVTASEHFVRNSNVIAGRFVWCAQLVANIVFHCMLAIGVWKIKFVQPRL
jgi:hypothetical protein